jgi:hypothetical protein
MEAGRSLTFEERLPQSARSKQESMRQSRCIFAPSCRTLHHPRYDHQTLSHELLQLQEQLTSLHPVEPDMMQSQTGVALKHDLFKKWLYLDRVMPNTKNMPGFIFIDRMSPSRRHSPSLSSSCYTTDHYFWLFRLQNCNIRSFLTVLSTLP